MKNLNKLLIASTIAFASMGANAELISTDWKTTGDSLATLDEATGLEWLDLTQTDYMSISQVESSLTTAFVGWRFPSRAEVNEMMIHAFPSEELNVYGSGAWNITSTALSDEAHAFVNLFGSTYVTGSKNYSFGYLKSDESESPSVLSSGAFDDSANQTTLLYSSTSVTSNLAYRNHTYGVFLVSDGGTTLSSIDDPSINVVSSSVPLPATVLLLGLGLTGLMRKKVKS